MDTSFNSAARTAVEDRTGFAVTENDGRINVDTRPNVDISKRFE